MENVQIPQLTMILHHWADCYSMLALSEVTSFFLQKLWQNCCVKEGKLKS